jgi:hypothetical protein
MKTKTVGYSYPSSPNACQFGFSKTGCYSIATIRHDSGRQPPFAVAAKATLAEAFEYANAMPEEYDVCSLKPTISTQ